MYKKIKMVRTWISFFMIGPALCGITAMPVGTGPGFIRRCFSTGNPPCACLLIIPFAMVPVHYRGIPSGWRLIVYYHEVVGSMPRSSCLHEIKMVETKTSPYEIL